MSRHHIQALDHAKGNQWDLAHKIIQVHSDDLSCLIHGYLHRVEGDLSNARYWYNRAGKEMPDNSLPQELARLTGLAKDQNDAESESSVSNDSLKTKR